MALAQSVRVARPIWYSQYGGYTEEYSSYLAVCCPDNEASWGAEIIPYERT